MVKNILHILHGYAFWIKIRIRYRLNYDKVLLILVNENRKLDDYALAHLDDYMHRKYAKKAVVLYADRAAWKMAKNRKLAGCIKQKYCPRKKIELLYDFYSFDKFYDNVVFTYTSKPKGNLLGRLLKETQVNEEDAVCLGLYRLRTVPPLDRGENKGKGKEGAGRKRK